MKKKISITLSAEVLAEIDQFGGPKHSRSAVIERVLQDYLRERASADVEARDLELINRAADRLNLETATILDYQVIF